MRGRADPRGGFAFLLVTLLVLVAATLVFSQIYLSTEDVRTNRRAQDYQQGRLLAEAGLDYATAKLKHHLNGYRFTMSDAQLLNQFNNELNPPNIFPGLSSFVFTSPSRATTLTLNISTPITYGNIPSGTFFGYDGKYQQYEILAGVRNTVTGTTVALRKKVQISSAHLVNFGMFFERDLEIVPTSTTTFDGGVHSNSDIYLGGPLTLRDRLTARRQIFHRKKFNSTLSGNVGILNNAGAIRNMVDGTTVTDCDHPDWADLAIAMWDGRVRSSIHGVGYIRPLVAAFSDPRDIILPPLPPADPLYNAERESDKFANKAGLRITVAADGTVNFVDFYGANMNDKFRMATLNYSGLMPQKSSTGQYSLSTEGAYTAPKLLFDPREQRYVKVLDLYVDQLIKSFGELYSGNKYTVNEGRGLVYVTFGTKDAGTRYAIRLRNARNLNAAAGASFVSDLPVYVEGEFNTVSPKVALVAGDAVNFLSNNWQDLRATGNKVDRPASSTIYNLAVLAGGLETVPYQVENAGIEGVLRVSESWTGKTFIVNGSIIALWNSFYFSAARDLQRYDPPVMDIRYDEQYLSLSPPGLPHGFVYDELGWEEVPYASQTW